MHIGLEQREVESFIGLHDSHAVIFLLVPDFNRAGTSAKGATYPGHGHRLPWLSSGNIAARKEIANL